MSKRLVLDALKRVSEVLDLVPTDAQLEYCLNFLLNRTPAESSEICDRIIATFVGYKWPVPKYWFEATEHVSDSKIDAAMGNQSRKQFAQWTSEAERLTPADLDSFMQSVTRNKKPAP